jgi:hypothetical protein
MSHSCLTNSMQRNQLFDGGDRRDRQPGGGQNKDSLTTFRATNRLEFSGASAFNRVASRAPGLKPELFDRFKLVCASFPATVEKFQLKPLSGIICNRINTTNLHEIRRDFKRSGGFFSGLYDHHPDRFPQNFSQCHKDELNT